jgi:Arc/MetJ-type ribon-helix-helix transcriptional regulator
MYGIMRPKKTTIYLPDELKKSIDRVAKEEGVSAATIIRDAVTTALQNREAPAPRIPLVDYGLGAPDIAERVDELLGDGFGR